MRGNKGITLIALVITIIVLLILAGISIATLIGENGLITKAEEAKYKTAEAQQYEGEKLENIEKYINNHIDANKEQLQPTDLYVTLYVDGTLGFSNNNESISEKEVSKAYGNIKNQNFEIDWDDYTINTPWFGDIENIKIVEITNIIVPTNMRGWFLGCKNLTEIKNIQNLKTNNVTRMEFLFNNCINLSEIDLSNFNTANVEDMSCMFYNCGSLQYLDLSSFVTDNVTDMSYMFAGADDEVMRLKEIKFSEKFNATNVKNMNSMFYNCIDLQNIDLSGFITDKVTDMAWMFGCDLDKQMLIEEIKFSEKFNTANVTDMSSMFYNCTNLQNIDLSNFVTEKVTDMSYMFAGYGAEMKLQKIIGLEKFNTSNVTNMRTMFQNCANLQSINLSNFVTENVTDMSYMFYNCSNLQELNLRSFNTGNVTEMKWMFGECGKLKNIYVGQYWKIKEETDIQDMYTNCGTNTTIGI